MKNITLSFLWLIASLINYVACYNYFRNGDPFWTVSAILGLGGSVVSAIYLGKHLKNNG